MNYLKIYNRKLLSKLIRTREGETKLGEYVQLASSRKLEESLKGSKATFVLLGLPEDIGVRANFGRGGAYSAWEPALNNVLNVQSNSFLRGDELLVLGHIDFEDLMQRSNKLNLKKDGAIQKLRKLCTEVDERVSTVVQQIVQAGKIPVIIGGGHNNAYGNLKGAARGLRLLGKTKTAAINCINCDAHSDFRPLEGRHSGNGFSYAFHEHFLSRYAIVGLHENYNSEAVLNQLKNHSKRIQFSLLEDIGIREQKTFKQAVNEAIKFAAVDFYGLELDMDAIENIPASAKTSSGISPNEARQYVSLGAKNKRVAYLHIAEAAPVLSHIKTDNKTGKLIAYLVTDFMKSYLNQ